MRHTLEVAAPPTGTSSEVVETPGFRLVEEDDVAFTLALCREVHRIYGGYQQQGLPGTDEVLAGLNVTLEMLAAMSARVRDGMPAMRLTVAAAQTREMLAVSFGVDPLHKPIERRFRDGYRALVAERGRALAVLERPGSPLAGGTIPGRAEARPPRRRWWRRRRG